MRDVSRTRGFNVNLASVTLDWFRGSGVGLVKILYIEDEPLLGELFKRSMAAHGFDTEIAGTGADGIRRTLEETFDVIAIDYQLPDTTGIDLARDLLIRFPDLPLLMVTGRGDERLAVEAMTLGIANYVAKDDEKVYLELIPSIIRHLLFRAEQHRSQKLSEDKVRDTAQRLRTIVDASPLAILDMERDGAIISVNPAASRMLGLRAEESVALPFSDIAIPEDRATLSEALEKASEGTPTEIEFGTDLPKGPRYFEAHLAPLRDSKDQVIGILALVADVTSRHLAEVSRDNALAEAVQANKAKSTFLATLSHEFRTPLNAIMGFADVLRSETYGPIGSETYKDYAHHIHESGGHMLSLVNEVLDVATIEAGKREFHMEDIDLKLLIGECVEMFAQMADEQDVSLSADVDESATKMRADRRAIVQILQNLVSNALKFSDAGGKVVVAVASIDGGIALSVSDAGRGIPADRLAKVTEPFYQAHNDEYTSQEGSGLGLAIVKSLVDAHDGSLNVRSAVGRGTTVRIFFPN